MEAVTFASVSLGSGVAIAQLVLQSFGSDHRKTALSWMLNIVMVYVVIFSSLSAALDFGWLKGEMWQIITAGILLSALSFIFVFILYDKRAKLDLNAEMDAKRDELEEKQQQLFEIIERLSESSTKKD